MQSAQCLAARSKQVMAGCFEQVLEATPDIVAALIEQAKKGSCPHAKFLFDLVNAIPPMAKDDEDEELEGPSFAEILLERLQRLSPEGAGADSTPEGATAP